MQPSVFSIFKGDAKTMSLKVINEGCNSDPLDLTDCTAIDIALPAADGSLVHLTISNGSVSITSPPVLGKFAATISSVQSALLLQGALQSFDVIFTIATKQTTVRFTDALSVFSRD